MNKKSSIAESTCVTEKSPVQVAASERGKVVSKRNRQEGEGAQKTGSNLEKSCHPLLIISVIRSCHPIQQARCTKYSFLFAH